MLMGNWVNNLIKNLYFLSGINNKTNKNILTQFTFFNDKIVKQIECGVYHTLFLVNDKVYVTG